MRKLGILFVMLLLMSTLALAVPPSTTILNSPIQEQLAFKYPLFATIQQNQTYDFYFHVYNNTNGMPLYNNTALTCKFHLYNNNGEHLFVKDMTNANFDIIHPADIEIVVAAGNFSRIGEYNWIWQCNTSNGGGFIANDFYVTKGGLDTASDGLTIFIFLMFIIASLGLLFTLLWNIVKIATMDASVLDVMFSWLFIVLMLITIYLGDNYLLRRFVVDMGNSLFSISIWTNGVLPIISLALTMIFKSMQNKRPPTVPEIWGEHR
jgi:hypothetical protein